MTNEPRNDHVIDVWSYVQRIWAVKWTWVTTFALVMLIGAGYALTRPPLFAISQSASLTVPAVSTEAEATQQSSVLGAMASSYQLMALRPPVTDAVLAKHPEIVDLAMLRDMVSVGGSALLFDVTTTGPDVEELSLLVQDITDSLSVGIPQLNADSPKHLQFTLQRVGDPMVIPVSTGRLFLLVASGAGAVLGATFIAALAAARRRF